MTEMIELATITRNPLSSGDKINFDVSRNISKSREFACLRDFIVNDQFLYRFSCVTGIVKPGMDENREWSSTKHNLRYRFWNAYLHMFLALGTIGLVLVGIYVTVHSKDNRDVLTFCEYFGIVLQHLLLYPAVIYLRNELDIKRDIDFEVYTEAFQYATSKGKKVFATLLFVSILFYAIGASRIEDAGLGFGVFLLYVFFLSPAIFFLSGLLTFLILEQRISYVTMERVSAEVKAQTLTLEQYFAARESIDSRDKVTPINLLLFASVVNTLMGIVLIFSISGYQQSTFYIFYDLMYVLTNFGRQTLILVLLLWQIIKVNDIAEHIVKSISRQRWVGDMEQERVSVFIAAKEHPLGSTIFYYRPTKFEMKVQIASAIVGIITAVFWALIFA